MSKLVGEMLGSRYELREKLGSGAMGSVYKGWDTSLDRWIAVKVMHGHLADEGDFRQRFEREAKTIAAMNHPNIVTVYDFGYDETHDIYYIVLEYLASGTLEDVIRESREKSLADRLNTVTRVFELLADAVEYAHQRGMMHRDIKPSNILLNENRDPVLADFGLARLVSGTRITAADTTIGTPIYMAPEQGMGQPGDGRSDIYSLGVILFEMLAGKLPYEGDAAISIIVKHANEPIPSLTKVMPQAPPLLETVIYNALAKNADDRYQTASELFSDIQAALDAVNDDHKISGSTVALKNPNLVARQKRSLPLVWLGAAAALIVVVLAVVLLPGVLNQSGQPRAAPPRVEEANTAEGSEPVEEASPDVATPEQAQDTQPPAIESLDVFDEFNDDQSGWPQQLGNAPVDMLYDSGQYRFTNQLPGQARIAVFDTNYQYEALFAQVEAVLDGGQPASGYGLVFRWQDAQNFYVFAVNGLGQVSIWTLEDGNTWTELRGLADEWTDFEAVHTDGTPNTLALFADGTHLVGMVNREIAVDVTDDTFSSGAVGFYVATTVEAVDGPLADVLFDNFIASPSLPAMTRLHDGRYAS